MNQQNVYKFQTFWSGKWPFKPSDLVMCVLLCWFYKKFSISHNIVHHFRNDDLCKCIQLFAHIWKYGMKICFNPCIDWPTLWVECLWWCGCCTSILVVVTSISTSGAGFCVQTSKWTLQLTALSGKYGLEMFD